jgi:hypothetical protein
LTPSSRRHAPGIAEYADAVIALLLAVVFGVLGAFGVVFQAVTSAGVLTTLAVLEIVILRDRVNKVSLDREIRQSTNQSREIPGTLPDQLTRIDTLAGSIAELRGVIEGSATMRTRGLPALRELPSPRPPTAPVTPGTRAAHVWSPTPPSWRRCGTSSARGPGSWTRSTVRTTSSSACLWSRSA